MSEHRCRRARFATETQARTAASSVGDPYRARHCAACGYWHIVSDEAPTFRLPPALGRAVVRGDKTTHRVPAGRIRHCPYLVGHTYALEYEQSLHNEIGDPVNDRHGQQRSTFATETIVHVTKIGRATLNDITDATAAPEGFKSFAEFLDYWDATYGDLTDRRMAAPVWVVHFAVEHQDTVHLLPNLPHEPEAVDPAIVADLPASRDAQQRWHRDRALTRATYSHLPTEDLVALALRRMRELRIAGDNSFERLARKKATDILERLDRAA